MKGYKSIRIREELADVLKRYVKEKRLKAYAVADEVIEIGLIAKRILPPKSEKEKAA